MAATFGFSEIVSGLFFLFCFVGEVEVGVRK